MAQITKMDTAAVEMLAMDFAKMVERHGYPLDLDPDDVQRALPAFLRQLGVAVHTDQPAPAAAEEFVKHTCRGGRGPAWGRLAPVGECRRCDQLHAGAERRAAPAWTEQAERQQRHEEQTAAAAREHFKPGGEHARGACGPVCTRFDY
jgi:hypothetical protein